MRKFVNINKVYRVYDKDLGLGKNKKGFHHVILVRKNEKKQICRVKTITSLEKRHNGKLSYNFEALKKAKEGIITPFSVKELNTEHWSGIYNKSKVISFKKLKRATKNYKKPKKLY